MRVTTIGIELKTPIEQLAACTYELNPGTILTHI